MKQKQKVKRKQSTFFCNCKLQLRRSSWDFGRGRKPEQKGPAHVTQKNILQSPHPTHTKNTTCIFGPRANLCHTNTKSTAKELIFYRRKKVQRMSNLASGALLIPFLAAHSQFISLLGHYEWCSNGQL